MSVNQLIGCLTLIVIAILWTLFTISGMAWFINVGGTIGAIIAPFFALLSGWMLYKVLGFLCKRFVQKVK